MLLPALLATAFVACLGASRNRSGFGIYPKIVGGESSYDIIKRVPYMLALELSEKKQHVCGASIIGESWALTAATCVSGMKPVDIRLRSGTALKENDGLLFIVLEIISHSKYNQKSKDFDVAVLKVYGSFDQNFALELATTSLRVGESAAVSGWSVTNKTRFAPNYLQMMQIFVLNKSECSALNEYPGNTITNRMLCTKYQNAREDVCIDEYGGPLVVHENVQVGIVSKGKGCGKSYRGIFTDVAAVAEWIKDKTESRASKNKNKNVVWFWKWNENGNEDGNEDGNVNWGNEWTSDWDWGWDWNCWFGWCE